MNYKSELAQLLGGALPLPVSELEEMLEIPPDAEMGDYALPCFKLAKTMRMAPGPKLRRICWKNFKNRCGFQKWKSWAGISIFL